MRSRSRTWAESDDTSQEDTKGAKRAHARRVPFVYIHIHIKALVLMWRLRIPVKSKSYHQTTRVSQQEELEGHPPHKDFTHSRPTVVTHWSHRLRGSVTFFNITPTKKRPTPQLALASASASAATYPFFCQLMEIWKAASWVFPPLPSESNKWRRVAQWVRVRKLRARRTTVLAESAGDNNRD